MEQDKEQHRKQDREEDVEIGSSRQLPLEPDQEEKLRRPHSHSGQRQTAKSCLLWRQVTWDP